MPLFSASGLGKRHGTQLLFEGAEFTLAEGARVGLIGANGTGKSSLLRILLGLDGEIDGSLVRARDLKIASLEQDPAFAEGATVRSAVLEAAPGLRDLERRLEELHERLATDSSPALLKELGETQERFEAAGGYDLERRADRILGDLGFPEERHADPVARLSGGERTRLAFGRLLLGEPDLWLLDEPTNHLDLDGVLMLERTLAQSRGAALIVSHDRRLLDDLTTQTWEIEARRLWTYPASYTGARDLRAERIKASQRAFEIQRDQIAKTEEFVRRFKAGQRARQAAGRQKRLDRLARLERPEDQARIIDLDFPAAPKPGLKVLGVRDAAVRLGGRTLFEGLTFDLERGSTLGIVGPNGAGKTSLLRALAGDLTPSAGEIRWDERVAVGSLTQHEELPAGGETPFGFLRAAEPQRSDQSLRNTLAAMLFRGDDVDKPLSVLSGGERKRLMITKLLLSKHNVLVFDEPTNHLDLPSREALELALCAWEGTILVVSHDRYFLDRVADRILWIEDGRWRLTEGGFREALQTHERERAAARPAVRREPARFVPPPAAPPKPASKLARLPLEELEARIMTCEAAIAKLNEVFADPSVFRDPERLEEATDELDDLKSELSELEEEYLRRGS